MQQETALPPLPMRVYKWGTSRRRLSRSRLIAIPFSALFYGYFIIDDLQRGRRVSASLLGVGAFLGILNTFVGWIIERDTRLEILPTGVRLYWRGQSLYVQWQDMIGIETIKQPCYVEWEGITLRKARWEKATWSPFLIGFWPMPRFIPLWSGQPLWDRELGNDLRSFAPWVFDDVHASYVPNYAPQWGY